MVFRANDCDVVFSHVKLFQKRYAAPTSAQDNQLRFVLLTPHLWCIIVVNVIFDDWQVLRPARTRAECITLLGYGNVETLRAVFVCVGVIDEEPDHQSAAHDQKITD